MPIFLPAYRPQAKVREQTHPEFYWFVFSMMLIFLAGGISCRTAKELNLPSTPGADRTVREGQAIWKARPRAPELAGELLLSQKENDCLVQFSKTPIVLVTARTTRTHWHIEFPPQQLSYSGRGKGPKRFLWFYLRPALSGERLPGDYKFQRKSDGNWRLENTHTGERLEGFLSP